MREMVGGCCVCSDERGWPENPLVYCDGQNCTVAVHQACYGIVTVPTGPWYCRKCESQERSARVRCELCPSRDGALKKTDNQGWAHVVCALYIPEVRFGNVSTMEPIILALIPAERYSKSCYICAEMGKGSKANIGACMQCNKSGCKQQFHVTCAQQLGLLCEEAGNYLDNVKYCGYCQHHYSKLKKGGNVKPIPPYKPISHETNSSDSPSSPEKESEISHSSSRSSRPSVVDPLATSNLSSSSSSSKQKKSSTTKSSSSSSSISTGSNAQIPYSSSSNAPAASLIPSSTSSRTSSSSSSSKDKEKESKHSSSGNGGGSSSKSVNKISSSTNNKHDKDSSSYSTSSSRDKNKSSSSSKSSHQNASNKDDGLSSNSHNSKSSSSNSSSSSQFSTSTGTIRITTSSATPTSPVSTIIHKHDGNSNNSSAKDTLVQSSANSIMSSQIQNSSKINSEDNLTGNGDEMRKCSWHQNSSNVSGGSGGMGSQQKMSSNYSSSLPNSDAINDNNDSSKTNYSAMTKKRKAMHQANSSNRSSADENVNKDICKDLSVKVVPIDKLDPSVSEFERHYKKARTDINSQSTPAAATPELNIQNVNPNVIHSNTSTATVVTSNASSHITSPPVSTPSSSTSSLAPINKSQVITQNVHAKTKQQDESLVVSVPLSSATTVPGIQLPTNSTNTSINSSTIVTNQNQPPTASPVSSSSLSSHGSLYQHLTNNQAGSQRSSPLVGRASPIVPTGSSSLAHESHSNHTSVLQNMNSGVIASSFNDTSSTMHKVQTTPRIHALQEEAQSGRRSRSQTQEKEHSSGSKSRGSKKRTNNSSSSSTSILATSNIARTTQSNHHHHHHKSNNHNNSKNNAKNDHTTSNNSNNNLGGGSLSISATNTPNVVHASTNDGGNTHSNTTTTTTITTIAASTVSVAQPTIVKLSPAPSTGSARTSSPSIVNVTLMKKYRDEPSTSRTPDMSASSNTSTAGGLKFAFEPQSSQAAPFSSGLMINTQAFHPMKDSPPSSPCGSEASARKRRKATPQQSPIGNIFDAKRDHRDEKDSKTLQNGVIPGSATYSTHHMLGNQLNPASSAVKTMSETLNMEIEAHSIYTTDVPQSNLIGPQYPGRKDSNKTSSNSSSTTTSSGPASLTSMLSGSSSTNGAPQSLEQLLERQWEQGSQFLMEQAQHFDIASLLSCLHQLKIENSRLEDHINGLVSRRDHLLAVNARLAIPLGQPTSNQATHNGPVEPPPSQVPQSQQAPPPQQAPQSQVTNKRSVPANSASTIQAPPMENGLDYRGHHAISSSSAQQQQHQSASRESHQSQHSIRHSPAASKGNLIPPQVVAIDAPVHNNPQPNLHQPQQQQPSQPFQNAQFPQQMYHHQQPPQVASHVNSIRGRQTNSYQSQQSTSISSYPPPTTVHKTKN